MVDWGQVALVLGTLGLLDSLIVFIFPNWSMKFEKKAFKSEKTLRRIAWIEFLIAVILVLIGMNV